MNFYIKKFVLAITALIFCAGCITPANYANQRNEKILPGEDAKQCSVQLSEDVCLKMIWVPGGQFSMGSKQLQGNIEERFKQFANNHEDEEPQRLINIDGFWISKFEVTNVQYNQYDPDHDSGQYNNHDLDGDQQPAVNVSWNDANKFCEWLTLKTGQKFALPTEAQWEYSCRAGTTSAFYWGDEWNSEYGNIDVTGRGDIVSMPVGSFLPNAFGLYDMAGNVSEWCEDWYGVYDDSLPTSGNRNPQGPPCGEFRVLRGGSWASLPENCRSSKRAMDDPSVRFALYGFRVVRLP